MQSTHLKLINPLGLHARAASKFVDTVKPYACDITLTLGGETVDGKSIMSLLLLGAPVGSELTITADGEDEDAALKSISDLVAAGFYELDD